MAILSGLQGLFGGAGKAKASVGPSREQRKEEVSVNLTDPAATAHRHHPLGPRDS